MSKLYYGDSEVLKWYEEEDQIMKAYYGDTLMFGDEGEEPTPSFNFCYDVVDNITAYTSTTFSEVFDKATNQWYMLNNLNQYEEYGVYADNKLTYYEGKLAVVDNHEWKYTNGGWIDLGEMSGGETSFEFPDYGTMVGTSFPTTFKIAKSYCCGQYTNFSIQFNEMNGNFNFSYDTYGGYANVMCAYSDYSQGIDTQLPWNEDEDYYYIYVDEWTVGVPDSVVVESTNADSDCQTPFYVIGEGEISYIEEYAEKAEPTKILTFTSMTEANSYSGCVYNGEYANIGGSLYQISNGRWTLLPYPPYKAIITLNGGSVVNVPFDGDRTLIDSEINTYTSATSIEITEAVTTIGENIIQSFSNLTSITIPNSVTSIDRNSIVNCGSLTSITIPNSVTSIKYSALYGNNSVVSIHIGSGLASLELYALMNCSKSLTSITVDEGNTHFDSRNNCNALIETSTNKLVIGCKNTVIPNSVTSIGASSFAECSGLTSINIPNSVTSIGGSAFMNCSGLTNVTIGSGVTSIGDYAFNSCSGLTSVTIPNSVTSVGNYVFQGCTSLTGITIGSGVTSIGSNSFNGCTNLNEITSLRTTAPTLGNRSVFRNIKSNGTLYVQSGSSGYDTWMQTSSYYLGYYSWTKVEQ